MNTPKKREVFLLFLIISCLIISVSATSVLFQHGDANGDGAVNLKDVTEIRRFLASTDTDQSDLVGNPDVNGDSLVNMKDVTLLRRYLAGGWGVELPQITDPEQDEPLASDLMDYEVLESLPKPSEEFEQGYYTYVRDQIRELLTKYGKIDILWFDGGVMGNADEVLSLKEIYELQPGILVNDRMHGDGDFTTTECRLPEEKPGDVWEHCDILSDGGSWGFMYQGRRFKPAQWFYDMYDYCRKMGGNLLMNVGPQDDGTMPETFYKTLEDFKKLLKKV